MIVRLDLEGASPSIANIDDARILARPLYDASAARRQSLQMHAGRFVRAVFAPHHAEDAQLSDGGLASAEKLFNLFVFFRREAVFVDDFWSDGKSGGRGHEEILLSHFGAPLDRKSFFGPLRALCGVSQRPLGFKFVFAAIKTLNRER